MVKVGVMLCDISRKVWLNSTRKLMKEHLVNSWEIIGEIKKKNRWNFRKKLVMFWVKILEKFWEKFGEILKNVCEISEKNRWSFIGNLMKSEGQFGQNFWEKLVEILRTI